MAKILVHIGLPVRAPPAHIYEVSLTRSDHDRLSELEQQIAALRQELSEIKSLLEQRT